MCTSGSAEHQTLQVQPCVQGLEVCVDAGCGGGLCASLGARGAGREGWNRAALKKTCTNAGQRPNNPGAF